MMPMLISGRVVTDRLDWAVRMMATIRSLPLDDREAFLADSRNIWTADACLRRALEAIFDLGRHILVKGFGVASGEYKEVASALYRCDVLNSGEAETLRVLAGYRNRLVHFYHEVSAEELYSVSKNALQDVEQIVVAYRRWLQAHPEKIDKTL